VAALAGAYAYRDRLSRLMAPAPDGQERPPPGVEVETAQTRGISVTVQVTGTLEAPERVSVTSEVTGRVDSIRFTEGEAVEKGDTLVVLDRRQARAEVARAEARVRETSRETERQKELKSEDFSSQRDLDQAVAAEDVARADLEIARERLDDHTIEAPFDGVTGRRLISPGTYIEPGEEVTRLSMLKPLELVFEIPENRVAGLQSGMEVAAATPAYPGRRFTGTVTFTAPELRTATRTLALEARLPNEAGLLRPGMFMTVELVLEERRSLTVPEAAVISEGPASFVYSVSESGTARRHSVHLGVRREGWVEIREGLESGTDVVVNGHQNLQAGRPVRVTKRLDAGGAARPAGAGAPGGGEDGS